MTDGVYLCLVCPRCGEPPAMVFGPTQAICPNKVCDVIMWVPRLADGGMSNLTVLDFENFDIGDTQ